MVAWVFEGYPSVVLYRTGWSRDGTIKIGDTLTVVGWRARDDSPFALGREVTLPSGKHLFFGPLAGTVKALPSRRVTEPAKDSP